MILPDNLLFILKLFPKKNTFFFYFFFNFSVAFLEKASLIIYQTGQR